MEEIEAVGTFDLFLEIVELVSDQDGERVRVAKTRMSSDLALLIQNQQRKRERSTWKEVEKFQQTEFRADVNFDRAWQEMDL